MKTNGNDKSLESYKIFPYVAWAITILFSYFVYSLVVELKESVDTLAAQTQALQTVIDTPIMEIEDLDNINQ
jgi:hypothetical protein